MKISVFFCTRKIIKLKYTTSDLKIFLKVLSLLLHKRIIKLWYTTFSKENMSWTLSFFLAKKLSQTIFSKLIKSSVILNQKHIQTIIQCFFKRKCVNKKIENQSCSSRFKRLLDLPSNSINPKSFLEFPRQRRELC